MLAEHHEGSHKVCQRSRGLASPAKTTLAVSLMPALPPSKTRRKWFKAKAVSLTPTTVPEAPRPTTAKLSVQTNPPAPTTASTTEARSRPTICPADLRRGCSGCQQLLFIVAQGAPDRRAMILQAERQNDSESTWLMKDLDSQVMVRKYWERVRVEEAEGLPANPQATVTQPRSNRQSKRR